MNVAELILELQQLDPKLRVVVQGYEGGYSDVGRAVPFKIALNIHSEWYMGPHDVPDHRLVTDEHKLENAILIL